MIEASIDFWLDFKEKKKPNYKKAKFDTMRCVILERNLNDRNQ